MMRATWFLPRVTSYWLPAAHMFYTGTFCLGVVTEIYRGQSCEFGFTRGGAAECAISYQLRFRDGLSLVNISQLIQLEPPASPGISRHLPAAAGAVAKLWLQVRYSCPSEALRCVEWSAVGKFLTSRGTAIHRKLLPEIVRRTSQNYQNCLSIPCNTLHSFPIEINRTHQAECMQNASRIKMHHDASSKFMQIPQLSD